MLCKESCDHFISIGEVIQSLGVLEIICLDHLMKEILV